MPCQYCIRTGVALRRFYANAIFLLACSSTTTTGQRKYNTSATQYANNAMPAWANTNAALAHIGLY
eukprot:2111577-Lingulodinium_polyedra.AAC.1